MIMMMHDDAQLSVCQHLQCKQQSNCVLCTCYELASVIYDGCKFILHVCLCCDGAALPAAIKSLINE